METLSAPTLSIIIPVHNRAQLLKEAVASCLDATLDAEILIVDDASTDSPQAGLIATPNLRFLRQNTRAGAAAARNRGMREAGGKYLAFLDSDDRFLPHALSWRVAHLENHPHCQAIMGSLGGVIDLHGSALALPQDARIGFPSLGSPLSLDLFRQTKWIPPFGLCLSVFRRSFLCQLGEMDPDLQVGEDREYFLRAIARGRIDYRNIPTLLYRVHCGNQSLGGGTLFSMNPRAKAELYLVDQSLGVWNE